MYLCSAKKMIGNSHEMTEAMQHLFASIIRLTFQEGCRQGRGVLLMAALFFAVNASAQDDDDDIAYTTDMPEAVVLPGGMTFEEYLLQQVLAGRGGRYGQL